MIAEAEDENASAFTISKEDIDSVLQKGSGVADGKYRIYRQFQKGEDRQKNIEFLKNEYGTGGGTHIFPDGFSGHSWHDSKGLAIDRNGTYTNHDLVLKWSQVEKRLREMIKDNRYLNPKEKDHYADYLESLVWDGIPRIENMLPHFLGAESKAEVQPAKKGGTGGFRTEAGIPQEKREAE